jgi:hypothetical protein
MEPVCSIIPLLRMFGAAQLFGCGVPPRCHRRLGMRPMQHEL